MYPYQPSTPRVALGIAAVALVAITIGLAVVVPAMMESGRAEAGTLMVSKAITVTPIEVVIMPASIDVVAVRERKKVFEPVGYAGPTQNERS